MKTQDGDWDERNDEKRRSEIVAQCQEVIDRKYRFKHLLPKLEENSGVKLHV